MPRISRTGGGFSGARSFGGRSFSRIGSSSFGRSITRGGGSFHRSSGSLIRAGSTRRHTSSRHYHRAGWGIYPYYRRRHYRHGHYFSGFCFLPIFMFIAFIFIIIIVSTLATSYETSFIVPIIVFIFIFIIAGSIIRSVIRAANYESTGYQPYGGAAKTGVSSAPTSSSAYAQPYTSKTVKKTESFVYCDNCGAKQKSSYSFCANCGAPLR
ncbi:MAG: zinc ribbon domain-containing protein [Candidatus Heimdallarchaeaceae archaeon]